MRARLIHNASWRATVRVALTLLVIGATPSATSPQGIDAEQFDSTVDRPDGSKPAVVDRPEGSEPAVSQPAYRPSQDYPAIHAPWIDLEGNMHRGFETVRARLEKAQELISSEIFIPDGNVRSEYIERISLEKDYLGRTSGIMQFLETASPVNAVVSGSVDASITINIDTIINDHDRRLEYFDEAFDVILRSRLSIQPTPTETALGIAKLASLGVLPIEVSLRRMAEGQLEHVIGYRVKYAPPFRLNSPAGFSQLSSPTAGELAIAAYCIWATDPHTGKVVSERFFQTLPNHLPTEPIKVDLTYLGSTDEADQEGSRICLP